MFNVGDKVGLIDTGNDYTDTFAGQEVEVIELFKSGQIGVRTYNGICLVVNATELAPTLPRKPGRKPVKRADGEKIVSISATLPQSYVDYLLSLNPKNLSAAIRDVIDKARAGS